MILLPIAAGLASCGTFAGRYARTPETTSQANTLAVGSVTMAATLTRATFLAAIKEPVTSARTGVAMMRQRSGEVIRGNLPSVDREAPPGGDAPGTIGFELLLDQEGMPGSIEGRLTSLVDGDEYFTELRREIDLASGSIEMQLFIFDNDDAAVAVADRLRARSAEIKVKVLFDDLGTAMAAMSAPETPAPEGFESPADIGTYLKRDSHVEVRRTLNPWLVADHTKMLVFDGQTAYVGGMNIGREYLSEWHDLMVRVEGPVVDALREDFAASWRRAGPWGDWAVGGGRPDSARAGGPPDGIRLLRTDLADGRYEILETMLLAIRSSASRVWIETPYFSSDALENELKMAARRGIDVRVILPDPCDSALMEIANKAAARDMAEAGVKIYSYPGMTYLKAMMVDDWAMFGSANLDTLSVRVNRELNLATREPGFVRELERRVFRPDFRKSGLLGPEDLKVGLKEMAAEAVADQL